MKQKETKKQEAFDGFNFETFKEEALLRLQKGDKLGGIDGIFQI